MFVTAPLNLFALQCELFLQNLFFPPNPRECFFCILNWDLDFKMFIVLWHESLITQITTAKILCTFGYLQQPLKTYQIFSFKFLLEKLQLQYLKHFPIIMNNVWLYSSPTRPLHRCRIRASSSALRARLLTLPWKRPFFPAPFPWRMSNTLQRK